MAAARATCSPTRRSRGSPRLFVERFGFDGIRLTGGEPTVRAHLPVLVDKLARCRCRDRRLAGGPIDLALTTNGATLRPARPRSRDAGLRRMNISLDTLRPRPVPRDDPARRARPVLDGIDAAPGRGLRPGQGQRRGACAASTTTRSSTSPRFGRDAASSVRFIEFMPLDASGRGPATQVVSQDEILDRIGAVFPLEPVGADAGAAPADRLAATSTARATSASSRASPSRSATTATACASPPRASSARCLFALDEFDLRALLRARRRRRRAGRGDRARAVGTKWAGHRISQVDFIRPHRSMSQIGG